MNRDDVLSEYPHIPSDAKLESFLFFVGRSAV